MEVYKNAQNGRWMVVSEQTDLWGNPTLEVRWGGSQRKARQTAIYPADDEIEKKRRRELIARRRLNHGYIRVVSSD